MSWIIDYIQAIWLLLTFLVVILFLMLTGCNVTMHRNTQNVTVQKWPEGIVYYNVDVSEEMEIKINEVIETVL